MPGGQEAARRQNSLEFGQAVEGLRVVGFGQVSGGGFPVDELPGDIGKTVF